MPYYLVFSGRGRSALADTFEVADPFALEPASIVERVLSLGCVPDVAAGQDGPFHALGTVTEVQREDQTFLVAVSRDAEEISVQEARAEGYEEE